MVKFTKLSPTAICPKYANEFAVGMDLFSDEELWVKPRTHRLVKCNIAIALPPDLEAQVRPRSGLALKHGITVLNSPGTIDPDYRGSLGVILSNMSDIDFKVRQGDRIAQLVIAPFIRADMVEVEELPASERGDKGFGSTGTGGFPGTAL